MKRRLKEPSFVEILLSPCHEVIKTYVKLPLINVISLRQKQGKGWIVPVKIWNEFQESQRKKGRFFKL